MTAAAHFGSLVGTATRLASNMAGPLVLLVSGVVIMVATARQVAGLGVVSCPAVHPGKRVVSDITDLLAVIIGNRAGIAGVDADLGAPSV